LAGIPIPKPCFLDECIPIGARNGQKRWRSLNNKRLYTWDSLHGEIEAFNSRGFHLGALDIEGNLIKEPVKGRKIDV
jgi:Cytotoxic